MKIDLTKIDTSKTSTKIAVGLVTYVILFWVFVFVVFVVFVLFLAFA